MSLISLKTCSFVIVISSSVRRVNSPGPSRPSTERQQRRRRDLPPPLASVKLNRPPFRALRPDTLGHRQQRTPRVGARSYGQKGPGSYWTPAAIDKTAIVNFRGRPHWNDAHRAHEFKPNLKFYSQRAYLQYFPVEMYFWPLETIVDLNVPPDNFSSCVSKLPFSEST